MGRSRYDRPKSDAPYIDNNILTQGAVEVLCQPPDARKEAGAYGYIQ